MAKSKEDLLKEVEEIKNTIDSQKVNAEALDELGKVTSISFHLRGYSVGVKTIEGNDLKKFIDVDGLKSLLMSEFSSDKMKEKLNEAQAAADAAI